MEGRGKFVFVFVKGVGVLMWVFSMRIARISLTRAMRIDSLLAGWAGAGGKSTFLYHHSIICMSK